MTIREIKDLHDKALREAEVAVDLAALENVRITYLGRKGIVPEIMRGLADFSKAERGVAGRMANALKQELASLLEVRKNALSCMAQASRTFSDISLPGRWQGAGKGHPVSQVIRDAAAIFSRMGFSVAEGPDIETSFRNFEALNTPSHHPSLDERDTFWITNDLLLRTQTSPVQIRVMEHSRPPVRIITPGRCYRRDTTDATHSANFHQIEGLYVDRVVSLADLKGTMAYFARHMMGPDVDVRFRPHFFPFTEPSVEVDFSCHVCGGGGCRVCKNSGWIEIAGAGMVDPRVFEKVGYQASDCSGFAFGMGVERIAMVKYGIEDIRMLYENDVRFLGQFNYE